VLVGLTICVRVDVGCGKAAVRAGVVLFSTIAHALKVKMIPSPMCSAATVLLKFLRERIRQDLLFLGDIEW
jgi:hypothetical protein